VKRIIAICLVVGILFSGCSFIRKSALKVSEEQIKNVVTARQVAKNCLSVWLFKSGFIREGMGSRLATLPGEVLDAMEELDAYSEQYVEDPGALSDMELGGSLGLHIRILSELVMKALELYAPDVSEALIGMI